VCLILDPRGLDPKTRMPQTGISEQEARDVAAYLYLH
jgi:cytochrome c